LLELLGKPDRVGWAMLGDFPTPVQALTGLCTELGLSPEAAFVKRDDLSAARYGGNKVRTLEVLFGKAVRAGATHIVSTGAVGSNHALATALHAGSAGLTPGAILFPQPVSWAALENLLATVSQLQELWSLPHWSTLPLGIWAVGRQARRRGLRAEIMVPGGATPIGALGYVSAALELAAQVDRGELPLPDTIVVGIGSTCTSAGLLVGLRLAQRLGLGFRDACPKLLSVRVTPWPVTSKLNVLRLANSTARLVGELLREPGIGRALPVADGFEIDGRYLGEGYGRPTADGLAAMSIWRNRVGFDLDTTYSAKAAAALLDRLPRARGPLLFWSTKSSVPLPAVDRAALAALPHGLRRWIIAAERELADRGELPPDHRALMPAAEAI
jgi:D-cysteine desulfhydrase